MERRFYDLGRINYWGQSTVDWKFDEEKTTSKEELVRLQSKREIQHVLGQTSRGSTPRPRQLMVVWRWKIWTRWAFPTTLGSSTESKGHRPIWRASGRAGILISDAPRGAKFPLQCPSAASTHSDACRADAGKIGYAAVRC